MPPPSISAVLPVIDVVSMRSAPVLYMPPPRVPAEFPAIRESVTTEELRGFFDRCGQVGLRVIPWMDRRIPRERFRAHIEALKQHPALLCWYVYDEPHGEGFAEADARLALAKELDPARPAFINYLSSNFNVFSSFKIVDKLLRILFRYI